jgi:branched-chain amino acid transport system substrate-binding protein
MPRALAAVALLLALTPVRTPAADPFTIDVILPITGGGAFAGDAQQQAMHLYERLVNKTGGIHGRPLHFEIHDDQSNPVIAVQIVNELLPKQPVLILGPSVASTCSAVSPLIAKGPRTVEYCFSPVAVPPRGGYVFAAIEPARTMLTNGINHLRTMGYHRGALLVATDASGQQNAAIIESVLAGGEGTSLKLVAEERFSPSALGIAAEVAKVKAADPDLILLWANGPAFLMGLRELKNAGLDLPVVTNPFNADDEVLKANAGIVPKTLFINGLPYQGLRPVPALRATGEEYLRAFAGSGLKPIPELQAYCWDPMKIAITALRALPPGATATQLHDYIENLHDFPGLFGIYDFRSGDNYGLGAEDLPFVRWDASKGDWIPMS